MIFIFCMDKYALDRRFLSLTWATYLSIGREAWDTLWNCFSFTEMRSYHQRAYTSFILHQVLSTNLQIFGELVVSAVAHNLRAGIQPPIKKTILSSEDYIKFCEALHITRWYFFNLCFEKAWVVLPVLLMTLWVIVISWSALIRNYLHIPWFEKSRILVSFLYILNWKWLSHTYFFKKRKYLTYFTLFVAIVRAMFLWFFYQPIYHLCKKGCWFFWS